MKSEEQYKTAKDLYEQGYRYKYIMKQLPVSYSTLKRWKRCNKWGNGVDRRKYNHAPFRNQNAKGHGAPYRNRNAWKHGAYAFIDVRILRLIHFEADQKRKEQNQKEEQKRQKEQEKERKRLEREAQRKQKREQEQKIYREMQDCVVLMVQSGIIDYDTFGDYMEDTGNRVPLWQMKKKYGRIFYQFLRYKQKGSFTHEPL